MLYSTQPVYSFSGKNKDPKNWTEIPGPGNYNWFIFFKLNFDLMDSNAITF